MRFLVVDDEPDLRMILQLNLERWGHDVVLAASAGEAYDAIREGARSDEVVDAMLLDVSMPGETGLELLDRLRADGMLPPRVAVLSAGLSAGLSGRRSTERTVASVPPDIRHLSKPFGVGDLQSLVAELAGEA